MVIKKYEQDGLLFNVSFVDRASEAGVLGFRGRLALVEGEVADESGNRKPPKVVMEHVVLLSRDDKLILAAGSLDDIQDLSAFVDKYKADFAPDMKAIIYVVNITEPMQVDIEGITFALIPMQEGITWNELLDEAGLEKNDLKKKSSGDKVYTVWQELKGFAPKGEKVSLDVAMSRTADIKRIERGAL